jgi:hypothetical protein
MNRYRSRDDNDDLDALPGRHLRLLFDRRRT